MCKHTHGHPCFPASHLGQEHSHPDSGTDTDISRDTQTLHSCLTPGHAMHIYMCVHAHTVHICVHTLYSCMHAHIPYPCLYTCIHVCVCTHTVLTYPVKSRPTMCLAGGTGCVNHVFGISGLPALSGFLLPISALRWPQEVLVSLAAKFQPPLTHRETETPPASCKLPKHSVPTILPCVWLEEIKRDLMSVPLQSRQLLWPPQGVRARHAGASREGPWAEQGQNVPII